MDPQAYKAYRDRIGDRITRKLIDAFKAEKISREELREISRYILDNIDNTKSNSDMLVFLEELAQKYPIFADDYHVEESEQKEEKKDEKVEEITKLIENNKVDEAIDAAHKANEDIKGGTTNA